MVRLIALVTGAIAALAMSLALAGTANAADETAEAGLTMTPRSGILSKTELSPVNWRVDARIQAPASSPTVLPMKNIKTTFPTDMKFVPKNDTPICGDADVGPPPVNLSVPPDEVISRCPNSVLGNGTAVIRLGQANCDDCFQYLADPVLVIFNGGKNGEGLPKLKIYGYSAQTTVGIYMVGVLRNGVLDVSIPQLTADSATAEFNLNIPGSDSPFANRRGVDPSYVQAKCSTGTWVTDAVFTLGTRDAADNPTSPDSIVNAPTETQPCVGVNTGGGKLKFGGLKIKGPGNAKRGKKVTYKVKVKNRSSSTIKKAKVVVKGKGVKGKAGLGSLKAGKSKTVKVKVKFRKKGKVKVKFKASGKKAAAKTASRTVKVK
ncbi:MAG: CARDB domain-containing protein [Solirubrobacterales bacterium]